MKKILGLLSVASAMSDYYLMDKPKKFNPSKKKIIKQ